MENFEETPLWIPEPSDYEKIKSVLKEGMKSLFDHLEVDFVDCPDLSKAPFGLASEGICGHPILIDCGGPNNLNYPENHGVRFDSLKIAKTLGRENHLMIGPGAASPSFAGCNAELMVNSKGSSQLSKYTLLNSDESYDTKPHLTFETGPLLNLCFSEGHRKEKVLKIVAKGEKTKKNFVSAIRESLLSGFPQKPIGLGGAISIVSGRVHAHVMKDFLKKDLLCSHDVDSEFLRFFSMPAPLTCVSVLITSDENKLDFRMEHTHFWSSQREGGHYHHAADPKNEISYEAYYVFCEKALRIGRPIISIERQKSGNLFK